MKEDYNFYNCYCQSEDSINFKEYVLNQLRRWNYFSWLRDEPMNITEEKYFLNSTNRIRYLEKEIERDDLRISKAKWYLKKITENPDREYENYVKNETEKWQAQYNTKIHNTPDYATKHIEYLNHRATKLEEFIGKWTPPAEYENIREALKIQLDTVRREAEKEQSDRELFYEKLTEKPELMSEEEFIKSTTEDCEDIIKGCQGYISDNKKNIKRMKKEDEATHKLFESLDQFDVEVK